MAESRRQPREEKRYTVEIQKYRFELITGLNFISYANIIQKSGHVLPVRVSFRLLTDGLTADGSRDDGRHHHRRHNTRRTVTFSGIIFYHLRLLTTMVSSILGLFQLVILIGIEIQRRLYANVGLQRRLRRDALLNRAYIFFPKSVQRASGSVSFYGV